MNRKLIAAMLIILLPLLTRCKMSSQGDDLELIQGAGAVCMQFAPVALIILFFCYNYATMYLLIVSSIDRPKPRPFREKIQH